MQLGRVEERKQLEPDRADGNSDLATESQVGIKIARRNINNLRYADDTTLMAESGEEQKSLLMRVKEECERTRLKTKKQKN